MNRPTLLLVVMIGTTGANGAPPAVGGETTSESPVDADVILPDCPAAALGASALLAALELELGHDGIRHINRVASLRAEAGVTLEVELDCEPDADQVRLRVRHTPHQETIRAMDIADLPRRLRARGVALAAAELVRSIWSRAPRPAQVEDASSGDAAADAGDSVEPSEEAAASSRPLPRQEPERPTPKPPDQVAMSSSPVRPPQRRLALAAGPATRRFLRTPSAAIGGRVVGHIGRLRAGADVLCGYDSRFDFAPKLGLAVGWAALDAFARGRGNWRFATGPRFAAGVGWSRTPTSNQTSPLGGPLPVRSEAEPTAAAETTRGWYLEGALVADLLARTRAGWHFALGIEVGLGWGTAPGSSGSIGPNVGASLLVGHDF